MTTPLSYSLSGAVAMSGLSKATLQRAIRSGRLAARKSSIDETGEPAGVFVILHSDLEQYLKSLVAAS